MSPVTDTKSHTVIVRGRESTAPIAAVRHLIEHILKMARSADGEYKFLILYIGPSTQPPTLEFQHSGSDRITHHHVSLTNLGDVKGYLRGLLIIPDQAIRSGLVDTLNGAARNYLQTREVIITTRVHEGGDLPKTVLAIPDIPATTVPATLPSRQEASPPHLTKKRPVKSTTPSTMETRRADIIAKLRSLEEEVTRRQHALAKELCRLQKMVAEIRLMQSQLRQRPEI